MPLKGRLKAWPLKCIFRLFGRCFTICLKVLSRPVNGLVKTFNVQDNRYLKIGFHFHLWDGRGTHYNDIF